MPLQLVHTNIVHMDVDAIVNAANSSLSPGGGVCGAIFAAADYARLERACRRIGHCEVGEAVVTPGYGLRAKWVIHAVGPIWRGGCSGERTLLRGAYRSALELAAEKGCASVAFPLISSGIYGYPREEAFRVAVDTIEHFLEEHELQVYLILYEANSVVMDPQRYAALQTYLSANLAQEPARRPAGDFITFQRQLEEQIAAPEVPAESERSDEHTPASFVPAWPKEASAAPAQEDGEREDDDSFHCLFDLFSRRKTQHTPDGTGSGAQCREGRAEPSAAARPAPQSAGAPRRRTLEDLLFHMEDGFSASLLRLIDERGMTDVEVYKRANLDRKLFSKLRKASYRPGKQTVIALAIALRLNLDETADLLRRAGYALSPSSRADVIVRYFIEERIYDIFAVNEALFSFGEKLLGA